jgi:hypothetical protein
VAATTRPLPSPYVYMYELSSLATNPMCFTCRVRRGSLLYSGYPKDVVTTEIDPVITESGWAAWLAVNAPCIENHQSNVLESVSLKFVPSSHSWKRLQFQQSVEEEINRDNPC